MLQIFHRKCSSSSSYTYNSQLSNKHNNTLSSRNSLNLSLLFQRNLIWDGDEKNKHNNGRQRVKGRKFLWRQ